VWGAKFWSRALSLDQSYCPLNLVEMHPFGWGPKRCVLVQQVYVWTGGHSKKSDVEPTKNDAFHLNWRQVMKVSKIEGMDFMVGFDLAKEFFVKKKKNLSI
jgi:hypothetical protein